MPELLPYEPGSPDWLAARRHGVTATDIVTILGLSAHASIYSLYWQKLGQVPDPPGNDRWRLGRELEPYIVTRWYEASTSPGYFAFSPAGLYRHSERAWQMATPDLVLRTADTLPSDSADPAASVLEVKSWADAARHMWQDGPPAAVRAQVLWQMDTLQVDAGHVGVLFLPSGEFRSYVIEHDHEHPGRSCDLCYDLELMRGAGEEFMARLRLELPAPDPDSSAATLAAVRARFARTPDKTAEVDEANWADFRNMCDIADSVKNRKRELEIQLREQAGEASVYTVDGQPVARRVVSDAQVKAHTRHNDYLYRIPARDEAPDES
jgi:YqaJ-like viral recombinase domain